MPTYEYRCPDGHSFEQRAKMSEAASELPCPTCRKLATRQLSGGAALVFKGSGFYLTDYGKNAHRKPGPDGAGASSSRDGDSGGGESKAGEKSGDSKPTEAKTTESKSSEQKSGEQKPSSKSTEKSTSFASGSPASNTPNKKSDS
jgi:putative FmdB family regulatory protein